MKAFCAQRPKHHYVGNAHGDGNSSGKKEVRRTEKGVAILKKVSYSDILQ